MVFCFVQRLFNLKGGGMVFFSKKLIPNVAEKNILILVEEKKNNLIQGFCHIV
jgi:ribose 5-phosphate isomerase